MPWEDDELGIQGIFKIERKKVYVVGIIGYKWKEIVSHICYFIMNVRGRIGGGVS